jgi:hypothetical protein
MKKIPLLVLLFFIKIYSTTAITSFTSVSGGPFLTAGTWSQSGLPVDADGIPDANDDVIISPSHAVTISINASTCNNLTVNGTLQFIANVVLVVKGNYTMAGSESGSGTIRFDSPTGILTVTGTVGATPVYHFNSALTISSNSVISKLGSTTRITNGAVVTNLGNFTIGAVTTGLLSRWVNGAGSTLTLRTTGFFTSGIFDPSAASNTVILNFNGSVVPKTLSGYNNLSTISSLKTLSENTIVSGNLTIASGATLAASTFSLSVAGDWLNSGTFAQNTGTVIFNGSTPQSISGTGGANFYGLMISSSSTVNLTVNATVSSLLTLTSGIFNTDTYTVTGGGGFTAIGGDYQTALLGVAVPALSGAYSLTGGTVTFNGAGAQTIRGGTYYNIVAAGSSIKTAGGNLDINGTTTISSELDVSTNIYDISLANNLINNGIFTARTGTVTFDGTTTISGSSTSSFNNVNISGTLTAPASANINVASSWINNGTFTHNSGTVTFNNITTVSGSSATSFGNVTISGTLTGHATNMNIAGNWINNGTFTHNSGTVTFNGTTLITGSSTNSFNQVTISGTLTAPSAANVNVAGNWANNGTFVHNTGTVTFNGTTTVSGSSASSFRNVTISGTLIGHTTNIDVAGNWVNNGTFTHNSGTVTFNGTTPITGSSTNSFNHITISGTLTAPAAANINVAGNWVNDGTFTHNSGTVTFNNTTTVSGSSATGFRNVTISGTLTGHATNMNVAGNWINNGTFTHNSGTVTFNGATPITGSSTNSFNNVTISGTLTAPSAANINVSGNWVNNGTFAHNSGTITFNGTTTISGSISSGFRNVTISGALTGHATNMNVAGNWSNGGTFTHNSGTVTFNGITAVTGVSTTDFNNVTINGTFTGHPSNMSVAGNWVNNGTYAHNLGTTTFNGISIISGSSTSTFHTIVINGILTGHSTNLNISGDFDNNGTYNSNSGLITFNGLSAQVISGNGTGTFESLTLSNASGLSINSGTYDVEGTLTITAGTLANISGSITLTSDASRYARIDAISAGCGTCGFSGDFTVQRYFPSRTIGTWANLSSPVSNATMSDWDNNLFMVYPFLGYDPNTGRPKGTNVLAYDEVSAYYYELNSSTPLSPTQGFEIGLTDDGSNANFSTTVLSTMGTPNFGTFNIPLSFTAVNGPAYPVGYSGQNLVGNPFASAVAISGMTITNALSTVDVYDYTIDNYTTLTSSDVIGPYQGFWAYAQLSGASILIPETAKTTDNNIALHRSAKKEARPYLNLTLSSADHSNTMAHTLMVACNENASDGWDNNDHPFRKSLNPKAPNITANAGEAVVSINTFNNKHETYVMPLNLNIGIEGKYQLLTSGIENVNDYAVVLLEDKLTHTFIDLNNSNNYTFSANTTDSKKRFVLHFSKSASYTPASTAIVNNLANEVQILQNNAGNTINFNLAKTENTLISVMDLLGKNIIENMNVEANNQSINITLPENFHGLYFITIQSASGKTVKKFVTAK